MTETTQNAYQIVEYTDTTTRTTRTSSAHGLLFVSRALHAKRPQLACSARMSHTSAAADGDVYYPCPWLSAKFPCAAVCRIMGVRASQKQRLLRQRVTVLNAYIFRESSARAIGTTKPSVTAPIKWIRHAIAHVEVNRWRIQVHVATGTEAASQGRRYVPFSIEVLSMSLTWPKQHQ